MSLFIGLMSGTSADGMDAALVRLNEQGQIELIDALCIPYIDSFQFRLRTMALRSKLTVLEIMQLERELVSHAVSAIQKLIKNNNLTAKDITAIGSHGHTLRHKPAPQGFSWQLDDPNWIAERTGITCVADFRRRDIAAGGEGAPLVPAFHASCLPKGSAVLNIGGIANLTIVAQENAGKTIGFDTGPGNALIDEWCKLKLNRNYDKAGEAARSGNIIPELLNAWLAEPYFQQPPPKSTGRELFQLSTLGSLETYDAKDVLATLTELTVRSIAQAIQQYGHNSSEILVCGGGVHNSFMLERLQELLPRYSVLSTAHYGIDPDWMEAMAFAWLAWRTLNHQPGNLPSVTGAQGSRVLGGIYWA